MDLDTPALSWSRLRCAVVAALLFGGAAGVAAKLPAPEATLGAAARETVERVEVPGTGASIVVTVFRPPGSGPFPWLVLSHGTAPTAAENRALGRYRPLPAIAEWVRRGYAVVVPVRRGYGASGGTRFGDSYGRCERPDYRRAGEGAAQDLLAVIRWTRDRPEFDSGRWLLVGQSAGGFASIYTASKRPAGLRAVLAFAPGRGGRPDRFPGEPCDPEAMARLIAAAAPRIEVPVLWFYAENDQYIGPAVQDLWFAAFRDAGGRGEFVRIGKFPWHRGHGVMPSEHGVPKWTPAVAAFFSNQGIDLRF